MVLIDRFPRNTFAATSVVAAAAAAAAVAVAAVAAAAVVVAVAVAVTAAATAVALPLLLFVPFSDCLAGDAFVSELVRVGTGSGWYSPAFDQPHARCHPVITGES